MTISLKEIRQLILKHQLLNDIINGNKKADVQRIIEQLGYIQIDTISVVERSHHHILWTRMPYYNREMLHNLLEKERTIFEYWSHAAAFLPMKSFRYTLFQKKQFSEKYKELIKANKKILNYVTDRIRNEGALMSKDFEHTGEKLTGWWNWKPAKAALEVLFMTGKLMVSKRTGFQKSYDLTGRVLPKNVDVREPNEEEYFEYLLMSSIRANGMSASTDASYLRKIKKETVKRTINRLKEEGKLIELRTDNLKDRYFTTEQNLNRLNNTGTNNIVHILSPFDNIVIQRKRLKNIFGFDYYLECYLPASKRKFGYFSMPVIINNEFAGTIDAKADRQKKEFIIKSMNLKDLNKKDEKMLKEKIDKLRKFALNIK